MYGLHNKSVSQVLLLEKKVIMIIKNKLAELLKKTYPTLYKKFVTMENGKYVLYIELLKYLYGLLKSELLFYKKLVKVLKDIGFKLNTYDPCVANIIVNDKQHTILCHVEDVKSYHVDPKKVMSLYSG